MWLLINYTHEKISHEAFKVFFFELLLLKTPQKLCLVSEVHFIQYVFVIVVFSFKSLPKLPRFSTVFSSLEFPYLVQFISGHFCYIKLQTKIYIKLQKILNNQIREKHKTRMPI